MLTVLDTFLKSQKKLISSKNNKIGRIVKISCRKTKKYRRRATRAVVTSLPIFEPTFIQLVSADSQQN